MEGEDVITLAKMVQEHDLLVLRAVSVLWRPRQHLHCVEGQLRVPAMPLQSANQISILI